MAKNTLITLKAIGTTTIRYDTIDDLHWKTDRQAASFVSSTRTKRKLKMF